MAETEALTLLQLNTRLANAVAAAPGIHNVWVTAETSDVRVSGGHCYLELVHKDPESGKSLAKARAAIWASTFYRLSAKFTRETGQTFRSDLKVMVLVNTTYHPLYGLSLNIIDINAAYTLGDVMQRRNEILRRLQAEGILNQNRELPWPRLPQRIAIISAPGAAGYGDFMKHLYSNRSLLRFTTELFPATMQGENTVLTVISALEQVAAEAENWDCVVIIRGGGATTDLLSFDSYDLAAHIAMFSLPVITGIGHDRDRTVLAYVSKVDVKTPTDAAQVLISMGEYALAHLHDIAAQMLQCVTQRLSGCNQQLAYITGQLPIAAKNALTRAKSRLANAQVTLAASARTRIQPQQMRLDGYASMLQQVTSTAISRARQRLDHDAELLDVLSPQATLRRGYSITRVGGHCLTSADDIRDGAVIETILAHGSIRISNYDLEKIKEP